MDTLDEKGNGWFGGVSFGTKTYHVLGRYETNTTDDSETDLDRWYAGAGWFSQFSRATDAFLGYESVGDFGHDSVYEINATFYASRPLGIGVGWEKTDDVETYSACLRWVL